MSEDKGVQIPDEGTLHEGEIKAREQGWVPKEEWNGDPNEWVNYPEFNVRGELISKINRMGGKLNSLEKEREQMRDALKEMGKLNASLKETAEREYQRAIADLRAERNAALREGEYDRADEIEGSIDELKDQRAQAQVEPEPAADTPVEPPAVTAWKAYVSESDFLRDNPEAFLLATHHADTLLTMQGDGDMEGVFKKAEAHAKQRLGGNQQKVAPGGPDDAGKGNGVRGQRPAGKKYTKNDLNDMQADVAKMFDTMGTMTVQEYVDQLAAQGELDVQKS